MVRLANVAALGGEEAAQTRARESEQIVIAFVNISATQAAQIPLPIPIEVEDE